MTVLDVTLMNVALPVIASEFNVAESTSVWLVTIYQLIIVMLLLPLSSIGDQWSYKRNFLAGVVVFTIGSALCAFSNSFAMLLASRALQALGGAGVMSVNVALTRTIYPRNILGRGLALNAMFIAIATAAGPGLAGWILSEWSWHWLFIINLPFGVMAFFIGRKTLPPNPHRPEKPYFDITSAFMNMVIFGFLFYGLGNLGQRKTTALSIAFIVMALAVGYFYVRRQRNSPRPMFPIDLFHIRLYTMSIFTSVCSFIAQNIVMIALPFLFLTGLHFSELTTGLIMTPWPVATMIVSPLAARFIEKHNPAYTAATGMLIYIAGLISMLFLPARVSEWDICWRMAVCGTGFGFFQTPNNIVMVIATPVERTGAAGGMQSTARLTGQTLGSTLVTLAFAFMSTVMLSVSTCIYIALAFAAVACWFSVDRGLSIMRNHSTL